MVIKPLFVSGWEIAGIRNAGKFFSAVPEILTLPVNLCLEGTSISREAKTLLTPSAVTPSLQIPPGTIWPKPSVFHVRATAELLDQLFRLAGRHAAPEICDHFHAYNNTQGLIQWYDAFDLPLLVDESATEVQIQSFCRKLGVAYARWHSIK